jgi:ribokinase
MSVMMSRDTSSRPIVVLGIFVADLVFRAARLPVMGETLLGQGLAIGPGGKGSNQAIAAARAASGRSVKLISRLGDDAFASIARRQWAEDGVDASLVITDRDHPTGAAFIFVSSETGDNAIIVESGAAGHITAADLDATEDAIAGAAVFMTQLEQPIPAARYGLALARQHGVRTILNPAPAAALPDDIFPLCDILTPNETEAEALTGLPVGTLAQARAAADHLLAKGVRDVVITLGERGALLHGQSGSKLVPAFPVSPVVDTTGAGDAFAGALAVALAEGAQLERAVRFGCAGAALSVLRPGAGAAMPDRAAIEALLSTDA